MNGEPAVAHGNQMRVADRALVASTPVVFVASTSVVNSHLLF
jgi:hypothetical protein